jgi:hypothetical protein
MDSKIVIHDYFVYRRITRRGWAISIMPHKIRIDNFHGYPHIHFKLHGIKHQIKVNNIDEAYKIVHNHINDFRKVNNRILFRELNYDIN